MIENIPSSPQPSPSKGDGKRIDCRNDRGEIVNKMWKNSFLKVLYNKGFRGGLPILIIWANFTSTYTFTLGK